QFDEYNGEKIVGEESPGYVKHPLVPKRAVNLIPDAKIGLCVRNPVERAYSQWWHAQKNWTNAPFEYALNYHAANSAIIVPGFYDYHISRWEEHYPSDQIKIVFFDDFTSDNESFIQDIYDFLGVDNEYAPSIVGERIKAGKDFNEPGSLYRARRRVRNGISELSPDIVRDEILRPV
ncbi:sulfotransferase domain-containing protein, partial [Halobellus sp. Atlit-38R]|uniref:sulfotransferase domain-containing protein n=1 Tax=Halobellus sp. Atlit-38R TaxID=2282131 RepID=UPI0011C3A450